MKMFSEIIETLMGENDTETQYRCLDILSYLDRVKWPLTAATIACKFSYSVEEVRQLLDRLSDDGIGFLQRRTVVDGARHQTYYAFTFPETFDNSCVQCCWFAKNHCTIWKAIGKEIVSKLADNLRARGLNLSSDSITCPVYQSRDSIQVITVENWGVLSNDPLNTNEAVNTTPTIDCLMCGAPIVSLFDTNQWCPSCGAEYFLEYEDTGELVIIIIPDLDWLFAEKVTQIKNFIAKQSWAVTMG
ncbi:MAG: hypothetical protein ACFFB3_10020 [Candidatus Hodarchaeota archaeon]